MVVLVVCGGVWWFAMVFGCLSFSHTDVDPWCFCFELECLLPVFNALYHVIKAAFWEKATILKSNIMKTRISQL